MYQKVIIVGFLSQEPEMKYLPDGTAITSFSMATNTKWTDKVTGQPKEEVAWWRVTVWGSSAENCHQYLAKGSKVLVEGKLSPDPSTGNPRLWTDKNGATKSSYELKAETVRFLSGKSDVSNDNDFGHGIGNQSTAVEDDDIPF